MREAIKRALREALERPKGRSIEGPEGSPLRTQRAFIKGPNGPGEKGAFQACPQMRN